MTDKYPQLSCIQKKRIAMARSLAKIPREELEKWTHKPTRENIIPLDDLLRSRLVTY